MYAVDPSGKKIDTQLLMLTHLSQLLTCFTGVGGLIVPLAIWNSSGFLELAIYKSNPTSVGSAASLFGLEYRDSITINF